MQICDGEQSINLTKLSNRAWLCGRQKVICNFRKDIKLCITLIEKGGKKANDTENAALALPSTSQLSATDSMAGTEPSPWPHPLFFALLLLSSAKARVMAHEMPGSIT